MNEIWWRFPGGGDVALDLVDQLFVQVEQPAEDPPYVRTLAQLSLRPSVRLKTSRPGVESGSGQK